MIRVRQKMLLVLVLCASTWAGMPASAIETWHPRLGELVDESRFIVVGRVSNVNKQTMAKGFNQRSVITVSSVLKGRKDISALRLLTYDNPNQTCPRTVGVEPQCSYILFLSQVDEKTDTYRPTERRGTKLLPADMKVCRKIVNVLKRHIAYEKNAEKDVDDLKEIVLSELESETLFDVGFSTLFYAQDENVELLNAMTAEDQVRLFEAFKDRPFWYMDWANLAGILFKIDKRSPELLRRIARKLSSEKDAKGPFGGQVSSEYKYFYAMCLVDASVSADLGTGIPPTAAPYDHVQNWKTYSDKRRNEVIKVFFEKLDSALPGWQNNSKESHAD